MPGLSRRFARWALIAATLGWATAARAEPGEAEPMRASRTHTPPRVDGLLDEPAWQQATPWSAFVESFPKAGAAPSQKTEVRVLYDDATLYIGVVCYDSEPGLIVRQLGRRDTQPTADLIEVAIDSSFDRRSAFYFSVNAAGVLRDALLYGDVNLSDTWDAVWTAKVAARPDGWSAEFALPLNILRFPAEAEAKWGFAVRRTIPRTHQVFDSTLIPRSANALVSLFGTLVGLTDVKPRRDVEVVPYLATRLNWRPQFSDAAHPFPRLLDPSLDLGLDVRAALLSDLTLNATVNPDFGQVEADQVILNLSNSEVFFPEKRPFFNQGLDLFEPVGAEYGTPHRLFYSRRIGLDTPIFGAAKISGTAGKGFQVGALDAVVMGPADPGKASVAFIDPSAEQLAAVEGSPDRRVQFHSARPLHVGVNDELPASRPTPMNFLAAVVRKDVSPTLSLGSTFASASPLGPACTRADFATQQAYDAATCRGLGGQALAVDWNWRSANRDWVFLGLLDGSRREGGPNQDVQRDGTVIQPGDLGFGGYFKAGKFGGEGLRFDVDGQYASPRLDVNATGYQPSQNQQRVGARLRYVRNEGIGSLHNVYGQVAGSSYWSTDGRWTPRGNYFSTEAGVTLAGYHWLGLGLSFEDPRYDVREINQSGVPFERRGSWAPYVFAGNDTNRMVHVEGSVSLYRTVTSGPVPAQTGWSTGATLVVRPQARLETRLDTSYSLDLMGARYVDTLPDEDQADPTRLHFLFGLQNSQNLSVTLRQTVVLTPTLTLQGYAQFFTAFAHYPTYYQGSEVPHGRLDAAELVPTSTTENADVHSAAVNLNVVLRWEYRLGSTLFLVYAHSQNELGLSGSQVPTTSLFPLRLGPGPRTDTVMIKLSYWFNA